MGYGGRGMMVGVLLASFVAGILIGPILPLGMARQTVTLTGRASEEYTLRRLASEGWTTIRSDSAGSARLITFERPRIAVWIDSLTESVSEILENSLGWLAWATRSGRYAGR